MSEERIEWEQSSSLPLSIPFGQRENLMSLRNSTDTLVVIIMAKPKEYKKSTVKQLKMFYSKVNEIVRYTGQDQETVARELKIFAISYGYPKVLDEHGDPITDEYGRFVPVSTKDATIEQMDILIKASLDWAFTNGIYI